MSTTTIAVLAFVTAGLLTMPVFAVVARGRPMDADVAGRGATPLIGRWVRDWLMWLIAPLERALVRAGVTPDALNIAGMLFGAAAGVAYARASLELGGLLVLAGGVCDVLDGRVARARGVAGAYGEFIDSVLDRFAEAFTFVGLAWHFAGGPTATMIVAAALAGSLLVSYTRAKGDAVGVAIRGGIMQRAERLVLLAAASIFGVPIARLVGDTPDGVLSVALWLIALGAFGTAAWRTVRIARELRGRSK